MYYSSNCEKFQILLLLKFDKQYILKNKEMTIVII